LEQVLLVLEVLVLRQLVLERLQAQLLESQVELEPVPPEDLMFLRAQQ
jgi:hypothetical protein